MTLLKIYSAALYEHLGRLELNKFPEKILLLDLEKLSLQHTSRDLCSFKN